MLTHVRTTVVTRLQEVAHARDDVTECGTIALMYDDYGIELGGQLTNVSVATEQEALKQEQNDGNKFKNSGFRMKQQSNLKPIE